jgi:hypothetical protein
MITTETAPSTGGSAARSRRINPYTADQMATAVEARAGDQRPVVRSTTIAARYSVAGQGRMLAGVAHKAIQSYLNDRWDTVTPDERLRLENLLPDLEGLCGFSPFGPGLVAAVRNKWGVANRYCPPGGMPVGWMIRISDRLSVWLAPISAAHVEAAEDDDEITLSHWTQAVRHLLRSGHDFYLGPFSRIGRRKDQLLTIAQTASRNGSRIRTAEYEFDWRPEKPDVAGINDLLWTQFATMQENEWRAILERTFAGRVLALRDGRLPTHSPCWGWKRDPQTQRPVPDEDEVPIVRAALREAAKYGPEEADKLLTAWHALGVRLRRNQHRDKGRTLLDIAPPYRVRYIRSRLADMITFETGLWRWYAPTVLEDLELVHGVELMTDALDPRRSIVWFEIKHPFPADGPLVTNDDAAEIRRKWEPKPCGRCYDCLRARWCQAGNGDPRDTAFGFGGHWTDDAEEIEFKITLRSDSGDRETGITLLSRPLGSNAHWYPMKGQPSADRLARVLSDEYCRKLEAAIRASLGDVLTAPTRPWDEDPELVATRERQRKLAEDITALQRALDAVQGDARASLEAVIAPQITKIQAQIAELASASAQQTPSPDEADITGLVTTLDVLAAGDLKTPQRTTSMIVNTLARQRASVSEDRQWVTFQAEITIPNRSGATLLHRDTITWVCRNSTFEAQMTRSRDRNQELTRRILRDGQTVDEAAAELGISEGTVVNKLSGILRELMPNAQARGAIATTPYLPSRRVIADLLEHREPDEPEWLVRAVMDRYCGAPGGNRCPSTWVARGHAWRRELHLYIRRAGGLVAIDELAAAPWETFTWDQAKRNQARHPHASWPAFLEASSSGHVELARCTGCGEPYDLLLNIPELTSPLVCTRCRTCAGASFQVPDMLLLPWELSDRHAPTVAKISAPERVVISR